MSHIPELVYAGRAELAEGPVWHAGALWWVDILAGTLNRLEPVTGLNTSRGLGAFVGAAVPTSDGRWLVARQYDCAVLDWATGALNPFSRFDGVRPRHRLNDGKCDPCGRFWVGSLSRDGALGESALFVVEASGETRLVVPGVSCSNGLAWSPAGDRLYYIDSLARCVDGFRFDPATGALSERKTFIALSESDGMPDGMTIDAEGNLWVALLEGGGLLHVDGRTGAVLRRVALPATLVTSCAFGGADLRTLFITTAWEGRTRAQRDAEPLAGSIFALRVDVGGLPVVPFKIEPRIASA